ncbi:MAG: hypothetical protein JNL58_24760 [Planctomyces sp.]|nr:hypothetical protein [Planctomyces sp.]
MLKIHFSGVKANDQVVELRPYQSDAEIKRAEIVHEIEAAEAASIDVPRSDGVRDRLDSRFAIRRAGELSGDAHYPEFPERASLDHRPFPVSTSRKGLQVQMIDDALALGIRHATLNVNLAALIDPPSTEISSGSADAIHAKVDDPDSSFVSFEFSGKVYRFRKAAIDSLDQQVHQLSSAGVHVYLILLNYINADSRVDELMRHPDCPRPPINQISAFNLKTPEGTDWYRAICSFLAARYSASDSSKGRVVGYIVGNEVNSHAYWYAMGPAEPERVIDEYHRALRVAHVAVRRASSTARVYISLDHFWTGKIGNDSQAAFGGKQLVDSLTQLSLRSGNFDWHVAHHPYPENLFEPRSWLDRTATSSPETERITFKNLDQLSNYLRQPDLLFDGRPRRIILSEQGFHSPNGPEGLSYQVEGFKYAWKQIHAVDGIDAFILHRHVDHAHEGGLNLGLWTRQPDSIATPADRKPLYEVFRTAE